MNDNDGTNEPLTFLNCPSGSDLRPNSVPLLSGFGIFYQAPPVKLFHS